MSTFSRITVAVALIASAGAASAQTTIITREAPPAGPVVTTTTPLQLTPVQRQTIYRTIVRERVAAPAPTVEYRIGARVPETVQLYEVPESVAVDVPVVARYRYMVVNNRVVLVDPVTSTVVAELN